MDGDSFTTADMVSNAIAALALTIAISSYIRTFWRTRKASLEVRYEAVLSAVTVTSFTDKPTQGHEARLVIVNHGPARAEGVGLKLGTGAPGSGQITLMTEAEQRQGMTSWPEVIPHLHPGQSFHLQYEPTFTTPALSWVEITWKDRRRRPQTDQVWLSLQHVR